ncbi:MAG: VanZ family protein [Phycisphaeraceae bacterium]
MTVIDRKPARPAMLAATLGGFAALFAGASVLGCDIHLLGVSDEAFRPAAHFLVYGLLAGLLAYGTGGRYGLAWAVSILFATGEELYQLTLPSRVGSFGDWAINLAGITAFLVAMIVLTPYLQYRRERRRYRQVLAAEGNWRPMRPKLPPIGRGRSRQRRELDRLEPAASPRPLRRRRLRPATA